MLAIAVLFNQVLVITMNFLGNISNKKITTQQIPPLASLGESASLASPGYLDPRAPAPWIKCS